MKILLISPLVAPNRAPQVYNIGLGYIAAVLKESGYEIELLDIEGHRYTQTEVIQIIKKTDCNIFAMGTLITAYTYTKWLATKIKEIKPNSKIWIGNTIGSSIPKILFNELPIDVIVLGEGETVIKELATATEKGTDLINVKGICFKQENNIIHTPEQEIIKNIDSIPFPAWELFPQKNYFKSSPSFSTITSRGCPYRCTYCYHPFLNKKVRFHSAERVIEEIERIKSIYGIKNINFADDLFNCRKSRVYEICDLMEKKKLNIKWRAAARVNLVDKNLLKKMKSAGCFQLGFGIESGSNKILKNINKATTSEKAKEGIKLCHEVGIFPECSFMIGNVGETYETIQASVNFIKETNIKPMPFGFFFTTPYPNTALYDYAKQNGLIPDELKLIKSYGEQGDNLLINFTNLSNKELYSLRKDATKEILKHYRKKNFIKVLFKKIKSFYKHIKLFGFKKTYKKIVDTLKLEF